jgi:hypothetical protein
MKKNYGGGDDYYDDDTLKMEHLFSVYPTLPASLLFLRFV